MCTRENFTLGHAHLGVVIKGYAKLGGGKLKSIMVAHKGSWEGVSTVQSLKNFLVCVLCVCVWGGGLYLPLRHQFFIRPRHRFS